MENVPTQEDRTKEPDTEDIKEVDYLKNGAKEKILEPLVFSEVVKKKSKEKDEKEKEKKKEDKEGEQKAPERTVSNENNKEKEVKEGEGKPPDTPVIQSNKETKEEQKDSPAKEKITETSPAPKSFFEREKKEQKSKNNSKVRGKKSSNSKTHKRSKEVTTTLTSMEDAQTFAQSTIQMSKEEKDVDLDEEKPLRELDYFHGFMAREDLQKILTNEGDFVIRITEVEGTCPADTRKEIVLSLMTYQEGEVSMEGGPNNNKGTLKARNVVIRRKNGYRVDGTAVFKSVKELVEHYQNKPGTANKVKLLLKTPIKKQVWEFSHADVKLQNKVLGEGAYGKVEAGKLTTKTGEVVEVAVKMAKGTGNLSKAKIKEMMKEARLMRNFQHKNVVRLYGVAVIEQPLYIILELINGGSLSSYLKANAGKVSPKEKLSMCTQSALGVEYLHKNGCIHRDIAARNCLYTNDKMIKISDFGLSCLASVYKIKTNTKLPVKWLAPETITSFVFTPKSDVYSFGVLVYEIWSDGVEPWTGISNGECKVKLANNQFLVLSGSCPDKLKMFVNTAIYLKDPNKRVSMSDVVRFIDNMSSATSVGEGSKSNEKTPKSRNERKKPSTIERVFRTFGGY